MNHPHAHPRPADASTRRELLQELRAHVHPKEISLFEAILATLERIDVNQQHIIDRLEDAGIFL